MKTQKIDALSQQVAWMGAALRKVTLRKRLPKRLSTKAAYWVGFRDGAKEAQEAWSEREITSYYRRNRM